MRIEGLLDSGRQASDLIVYAYHGGATLSC
jgi:hypothetical protein